MGFEGHLLPHAPLLFTSTFVSTHEPLQSLKPCLHVDPDTPFAHVGNACEALVDAAHAPQLYGEAVRSTHRSVHCVRGDLHEAAQPAGVQSSPTAHAVEHPLQVWGLERSASQPSAGSPLQSAHPDSHDAIAHAPATHAVAAIAWGKSHGASTLGAAQLVSVLERERHQLGPPPKVAECCPPTNFRSGPHNNGQTGADTSAKLASGGVRSVAASAAASAEAASAGIVASTSASPAGGPVSPSSSDPAVLSVVPLSETPPSAIVASDVPSAVES